MPSSKGMFESQNIQIFMGIIKTFSKFSLVYLKNLSRITGAPWSFAYWSSLKFLPLDSLSIL